MKYSCYDTDGYVGCVATDNGFILEYMGNQIAPVEFCPFCGDRYIGSLDGWVKSDWATRPYQEVKDESKSFSLVEAKAFEALLNDFESKQ